MVIRWPGESKINGDMGDEINLLLIQHAAYKTYNKRSMKMVNSNLTYGILILFSLSCGGVKKNQQAKPKEYNEQHRPQIHFSPKQKWMNDHNGMVFYNNQYNLFYQYYLDLYLWV